MLRRERAKIEYESTKEKPKSIKDIIEFLKKKEFNPEEDFYEFEISEEIKPDDLKLFLKFPYETTLTEKDNRLLLTTGKREGVGNEQEVLERMCNSKLSLHIHPVKEKELSSTTPSFKDILMTEFVNSSTPLILAHERGMTIYKKPVFDPVKEEKSNKEVRDIVLSWGETRGIDIFGFGFPNSKKWNDLSREERGKLEREFVEDAKMIVKEASWKDEKGTIEIMDYINLKKKYEDRDSN